MAPVIMTLSQPRRFADNIAISNGGAVPDVDFFSRRTLVLLANATVARVGASSSEGALQLFAEEFVKRIEGILA